jgi:hypothetical protein
MADEDRSSGGVADGLQRVEVAVRIDRRRADDDPRSFAPRAQLRAAGVMRVPAARAFIPVDAG